MYLTRYVTTNWLARSWMQSRPTICKLQARESRGAVPGRAQSLGTRGPGARVQGREQQEQGERALPLSALFLYSDPR